MKSNMTEEQIDRWLDIEERKVEAFETIGYGASDIGRAIERMYNGEGTSAFWGMSQALFMAVNADGKDQGLHIKIDKD